MKEVTREFVPVGKCGPQTGGIKEVIFFEIIDVITEDADFEIIKPKELPSANESCLSSHNPARLY